MSHTPAHQTSGSTAAPAADRSSIIAVTALPVLVVIAGVLGFLLPDAFTPLAPLITWALGVVMFFMGLTLTLPDFARIAKRPWIAVLGVVTQFVAMPLLGLLVVTVFQLPAEIAVGVILVGCAPGGTASNVVTFLAKGDTALSVSITTLSTLCAPILTPLLTLWLAWRWFPRPLLHPPRLDEGTGVQRQGLSSLDPVGALLLGLVMNTQRTNTTHREVIDRHDDRDVRHRDGY